MDMEIMNHIILVLFISLSCLFSFSASTSKFSYNTSPSSFSYSISSFESSTSPTSPFDAQSFNFFKPQGDETFSGSSSTLPSFPFDDTQYSFNSFEPQGQGDEALSILPDNIDPRLERICGHTDHPVECMTTIVPFLGPKVAIEPLSILKLELQAMDNKANEALAKASKLLRDRSTQKLVASCLETCMDSYKAILDSDKRVIDAISIHDAYQLSLELRSNVENVQSCEDAFLESDIKSPIMEMDSLLGKMIRNSLSIGVHMVHF